METFSALLALWRGIHRWPVNSPHKGQWRGALMFSLICALNKRLSKQSWGWWFETPSCSLWRQCNVMHPKDVLVGLSRTEKVLINNRLLWWSLQHENFVGMLGETVSFLWIPYAEGKIHGANMGPIWDRQAPDGPQVGPMNFAIWVHVFKFPSMH